MNITYENFAALQPQADGGKLNQRLWNFLFISLLLHLLLIKLLIAHYSPYAVNTPLTVMPSVSITINNSQSAAPARTKSPPAVPVAGPSEINKLAETRKQVVPKTRPAAVPPSPMVVLPVGPEQETVPEARDLIEKGLDYATRTGKQMEARGSPDLFMSHTARDKLIMAMTMQKQQDPTIDNPAPLQVYNNQNGDLVYQTGDSCVAIPAVLVPFTFKQINSIIATPVSCGNGKKKDTFSLK